MQMFTTLRRHFQPALSSNVRQRIGGFGLLLPLIATLLVAPYDRVMAQGIGGHTVFGDFKVDEGGTKQIRPISFNVILYTLGGRIVTRQTVANGGRYRFIDVADGEYNIVVEVENNEVARLRVTVSSPVRTDFRQDISMEWRDTFVDTKRDKSAAVMVVNAYDREPANARLFEKAGVAIKKNSHEEAVSLLRQIVEADPKDFEALTELGTILLGQNKIEDAEKAYLGALSEKPDYMLALINLGKLRLIQKQFEKAVETLEHAVKTQPQSATANYYLGEAYLQIKKGSKAVVYLREALTLDPLGKAEAHLRLAALYNAAGLKDKAAVEYEDFLKKKPDYPAKKKLEEYIIQNKKS
jgi:cytochrome c-type biogenesis protein CcmH/NrfG